MQLKLVLKFFIGAISLLLFYMLITQEVRFHSTMHGSEIISLANSPFRFLFIFFGLIAFCIFLVKKIRNL